MTPELKQEIERISKEFARGFEPEIPSIKGSGMLIVDPLSAYLSFCGFENKLKQLPENDKHPLVLIIQFPDGTQFIPAGSDLPSHLNTNDWLWI